MLLRVDSLRGGLAEGNRISETDFFDIVTIHNDQICYVKHVLCVFHLIWVSGRGVPKGLGHNLLMKFYSLGSSKMVVPLPSSRCLAEGNRILLRRLWCQEDLRLKLFGPPSAGATGGPWGGARPAGSEVRLASPMRGKPSAIRPSSDREDKPKAHSPPPPHTPSDPRPQQRLDRRLEEVAKAVGGGYQRLQMPLKLVLGVRETVAGHRLGAPEVGGGGGPAPLLMHPWALGASRQATVGKSATATDGKQRRLPQRQTCYRRVPDRNAQRWTANRRPGASGER